MLPVSLVVLVLETSGALYYVAKFLDPLMRFVGLPGEAALAYISSTLLNVYSAIAVIQTLTLTGKELIILATMCLISHDFFVECLVMKKTGSRLFRLVFLRIVAAFFAGWVLHFIVPAGAGGLIPGAAETAFAGPPGPAGLSFSPKLFMRLFLPWLTESLFLILQIFLIVFAVMFLQRLFSEFGIMKRLARFVSPLLSILGLPVTTAYVWIISLTVGVAYGAGVLIEEVNNGVLSKPEADLFNHHAAISHSQIEDTLLFVAVGVPWVWAALPRFILAVIVVWIERGRRAVFRNSFRVKVV
jgi:spore maturation protein SpmB